MDEGMEDRASTRHRTMAPETRQQSAVQLRQALEDLHHDLHAWHRLLSPSVEWDASAREQLASLFKRAFLTRPCPHCPPCPHRD